jgi:Icc-related predicted phosphoesterase
MGGPLRLVLFSDTHGYHESADLPDGDCLVFAGDMSMNRGDGLCQKFNKWWSSLPHEHKLYIGGNHDWDIFDGYRLDAGHYLEDESIVIGGITFHGSPAIPTINGRWAWEMGAAKRQRCWDEIHRATNVLITHGPAYGCLDRLGPRFQRPGENPNVGCPLLMKAIDNLPELKLHVCGHIHEAYGCGDFEIPGKWNVAICDEQYRPVNKPVVVEV